MTGTPQPQTSKPGVQVTKGATIAGSSTGLALLVAWAYKLKYGMEMPPEVAIVMAGILGFVAGRIWMIVAQILKKKFGINPEGE